MNAKQIKSSSLVQVLLDKYIYYILIKKSLKQSFNANSHVELVNKINLKLT